MRVANPRSQLESRSMTGLLNITHRFHSPDLSGLSWDRESVTRFFSRIQKSHINNQQSTINNHQSSIINRQSSRNRRAMTPFLRSPV